LRGCVGNLIGFVRRTSFFCAFVDAPRSFLHYRRSVKGKSGLELPTTLITSRTIELNYYDIMIGYKNDGLKKTERERNRKEGAKKGRGLKLRCINIFLVVIWRTGWQRNIFRSLKMFVE